MKLIRKTKKGFTLVELIVVIAIVAILAAVSVVSYIAFINQANLSADQQMVTQMNKIVQADRILNEYDYPSDALQALFNNGFNQGKMETYSSGYHYAYSMDKNKWYLVSNSDEVVYPEDVNKSELWGLYKNSPTGIISGVTKYIALDAVDDNTHFSESFALAVDYTIDLFGSFMNISGTHENITAINGVVLSGAEKGEGTEGNYDLINNVTSTESTQTQFENKIIKAPSATANTPKIGVENETVTLSNCLIVESVYENIFDSQSDLEFINCKFISTMNYIITYTGSVTFDGCEFRNPQRGINICGGSSTNDIQKSVVIKNCKFYGIQLQKALIQFAYTHGAQVTNPPVGAFAGSGVNFNTSVTIQNNQFYSLGSGLGLIRFHAGFIYALENVTAEQMVTLKSNLHISGNTIDSSIEKVKYVIGDDPANNYTWDRNTNTNTATLMDYVNGLLG